MKKNLLPFLLTVVLPAGAFEVPRHFFPLDELAEARTEAAEKPEMVGFLITDPKIEPS